MEVACTQNPGGMVALIGLDLNTIEEVCKEAGAYTANINSQDIGEVIKLCHSGNWNEAEKLHVKVKKVRLLFQDYAPIPAQKAILAMQTNNDLWNNLRPPLQSISSEKANALASTLTKDFEFSI